MSLMMFQRGYPLRNLMSILTKYIRQKTENYNKLYY